MEGGSVVQLWFQRVAVAKVGKNSSRKCAGLTPLCVGHKCHKRTSRSNRTQAEGVMQRLWVGRLSRRRSVSMPSQSRLLEFRGG
jgi:hypothetical protein